MKSLSDSSKSEIIDTANREVSISLVASWLGVHVPDGLEGRSWKATCPFGSVYHMDLGVSKSFRIYSDTNSAYCFDVCGYFTPVSLYAKYKGIRLEPAAEELLEKIGFQRSRADRWNEALNFKRDIDKESLAKALSLYCNVISPQWDTLQFEGEVSRALGRCLSLLDLVQTDDDVQKWMSTCKKFMKATLIDRN